MAAGNERIVVVGRVDFYACVRATGRRTLIGYATGGRTGYQGVQQVAVSGRFAYAVIETGGLIGDHPYIVSYDTSRRRIRRDSLNLGVVHALPTVTQLLPAANGHVVLRLDSAHGSAVALVNPRGVTVLDEARRGKIGPASVLGRHVVWTHGALRRSAPIYQRDRCPAAPTFQGSRNDILATPELLVHRSIDPDSGSFVGPTRFCLRGTGSTGVFPGDILQTRGTLALEVRHKDRYLADVQAADLATGGIINGPVVMRGPAGTTNGPGGVLLTPAGTLIIPQLDDPDANRYRIEVYPVGRPMYVVANDAFKEPGYDAFDPHYADGILTYRRNTAAPGTYTNPVAVDVAVT